MRMAYRLAALAGLIAVFFAIALWSQSSPSPKTYSFASPEGEPFLTMGYGGGGSPYVLFLKQYASGTAEVEALWNGRPMRQAEMPPFTFDELEGVLSTIVSSNLHTYDGPRLKRSHSALSNVEPSAREAPMDAPWFELAFVVLETDSATGEEKTIRKKIQLGDPETLAKRFPSVREFQGLAHLVRVYEDKRRGPRTEQ